MINKNNKPGSNNKRAFIVLSWLLDKWNDPRTFRTK
jgi:hypothetical protein